MGCYGDNAPWDCTKNFQRFSSASNFADYIQKVDIRCQTLEGLVKESGARLDDMGMVVVDAEGKDAVILLALVDREDFKPGFIMWEDSHKYRDASQDLVRALRQRGYKVGAKSDMVTTNGRVSDSGNFVAVLE
uniref:Uncharacterized protein n=1 Tax=Alexandrium andersonii TaxID=327968 RepID=A0A7S2C2G1_9DINO|mmetsp:Transcript_33311/g.75868  ORF Transcript_33311/g.75868 Transcript_33311/m.75868 type:complete len:133 (+) Transcript_33311:2-400(+)